MKRDGACESIWQSTEITFPQTNSIEPNELYDVLIAGGGITGLSTALRLQQSGRRCILVEAHTLGFGTTGGTTAHLNTVLDTPYNQVIKDFGKEQAQLLALGTREAIDLIKENIAKQNISCAFEEKEAYVFTVKEDQNELLEDMVDGAKQVNLPVDFTTGNPFPIPALKIALIKEQAQFNPAEYIAGLARAFVSIGGIIIEHCRVNEVEENTVLKAHTTKETIHAKYVVYATHIPPGVNLLHFRCAPYRSYAMAVQLKNGNYPAALGYDMNDPYYYYRTQEVDGKQYLIAGGEDHKTGHEENTMVCFEHLESHVRKFFDIKEVTHRWSSQYYQPVDGLPYIGHLPGNDDNIFVATGFSGNGMIYGSLSAIILSDIIVKGNSQYRKLFDPDRLKPVAGFSNFVKEGADVVKHLISGIFSPEKINEFAGLAIDEAKVVKYEGHTIALYKDEQHNLHALNSKCTHIHCTVQWNAAEKTWDCPCHGARFSYDGTVLTGPAPSPLQKVALYKTVGISIKQ